MVGFIHNNNNTKVKQQQQQVDQSLTTEFDPDSYSFIDSLLNFDGWIEEQQLIMMNPEDNKVCETDNIGELIQQGLDTVSLASPPPAADVIIDGVIDNVIDGGDDVNKVNGEGEGEGVDVEDESSSSSSSDDEEEEEEAEEEEEEGEDSEEEEDVKGKVEMEEGEIMAAWSDNDDEADDVVKGPVRSKNEVQDLPPVPPVTVTIQPHHQTLPVGIVLSTMGAQVIVEGVENHNPLSEGSILWITESRSPLGVVDEIFGPVKNPYYIVRFNSESEVPAGIKQGSSISFVPEFADYVLNNNNLYKKGYDASGENDEELSEELEFSDDEKEAEYKKMIKMSKRGSNDQKNGNMKKDKKSRNKGGNWKNNPQSSPISQVSGSSSGATSGPQAFSTGPQAPNFTGPRPAGVWPNGFPIIQPQNMGFRPNGFSTNVPFMQPNFIQQPFQNISLPNFTPFNPQFNATGQMFPSNFFQGVQPNFGANLAFTSWPAGMPQNNFNQSQVGPAGMPQNNFNQSQAGLAGMPPNNLIQSQVGPPMMFQGLAQGVTMPNELHMENNGAVRPPFVAGNGEASQNPSQGNGYSNQGGSKPFQRASGRSRGGRGGRGGQQSR